MAPKMKPFLKQMPILQILSFVKKIVEMTIYTEINEKKKTVFVEKLVFHSKKSWIS